MWHYGDGKTGCETDCFTKRATFLDHFVLEP